MREDPETEVPAGAELVARIQGGDAQAFAALFDVYFEPLVRFAYYMLGSRDAAKDVVQDVFVRVWERPEALDPQRPVKQYLYAAVRNRVLDERKREGVRVRHQAATLAAVEWDPAALGTPSPENAILSGATVQAALERLSERRREAVRLRFQEQMTHAEIGEVLGISAVAAERLVYRALDELRKILKGVSG